MAEKITQKLGFDASDAIKSVGDMEKALKSLNDEIVRMDKVTKQKGMGDIGKQLDDLNKKAEKAKKGFGKIGDAAHKAGTQGGKAVGKLNKQMTLLNRIVGTQALLRGWNALTGAFSDAAESFGKFEETMARTAQIARGSGSDLQSLTKDVSALAAQMGRPIEEVSSAVWDAIQNDVGDTAETYKFLAESHKLAQVTGSSLGESMNTVTSLLKAYGAENVNVTGLTNDLYTAIDKGRIKMGELETKMGQVAPAAVALGISTKELLGSIAAMTQAGLDGAGSMTQFRNILNKMISPTDELKKAFKELGVVSGPELIEKSGGLVPALKAILGTVNGNKTAFAAMFGSIRGKMGVLNLLSNDGKIVADTMGAMATNAGKVEKAVDAIEATSAIRLKKATEELNHTLRETGGLYLNLQIFSKKFYNQAIKDIDALMQGVDNLSKNNARVIAEDNAKVIDEMEKRAKEGLKTAVAAARKLAAEGSIDTSTIGNAKVKEQVEAINSAYERALVLQEKYLSNIGHLSERQEQLAKARQQFQDSASDRGLFGGADQQARKDLVKLFEEMNKISDKAKSAGADEIGQLKQQVDLAARKLEKEAAAGNLKGKALDEARGAVTALKGEVESREKLLGATKAAANNIKAIEHWENQAALAAKVVLENMGQWTVEVNGTKLEIKNMQTALDSISTAHAVKEYKKLEDAAAAAAKAQAATAAPGAKYHGGQVGYRAAGGPARGADTIATMLSPGEFVMNARSSRNFAAELQAMNAGQAPQYRESGGVVNNHNVNVGDINVSTSEALPPGIAREVADAIDREVRMNTARIRR
jgi:TP901 family phage tail tape measure protein